MKTLSFFFFFYFFTTADLSAVETLSYKVEGFFSGSLKAKYVYLRIGSNAYQPATLVNATVKNGKFLISGNVKYPEDDYCYATLLISDKPGMLIKNWTALMKDQNYDTRLLILEKEVNIRIGNKVKEADVNGGLLNELNNKFELLNTAEIRQYDSIQQWYKSETKANQADKNYQEKIEAERSQKMLMMQNENAIRKLEIVAQYPDSKISLRQYWSVVVLNKYTEGKFQEMLEKVWEIFPEEIKKEKEAKYALEMLTKTGEGIKLRVGSIVPDYSFESEGGVIVSLKSFRGKYLLLDFWTSWCGPCRAEHYYMKKAYEKYKTKNFTVFQVSLDSKKEKWVKAISQDNLPWQNILNAKGWDKEIENVFNFNGVPASFLVSPEGIILARNLRGEELERKLAEIINN